MNPFTSKVASLLSNQYHTHALEVDSHLRVLGAPLGTVYALGVLDPFIHPLSATSNVNLSTSVAPPPGDCATIETRLVDHLLEIAEKCDTDKNGVIDEKEFEHLMKASFSAASCHAAR